MFTCYYYEYYEQKSVKNVSGSVKVYLEEIMGKAYHNKTRPTREWKVCW